MLTVYGGDSIEKQIQALKKRPQIVVATPGRLMDHMRRGTIKLKNVKFVVLDEADEMLDMGFRDDINTILSAIESSHQTMLFSATISKEIENIAKSFLNNPKMLRSSQKELTVNLITQKYINCLVKDKMEIVSRLIEYNDYKLCMVFCNTKKEVDEVTSELLVRGFKAEALHGDMKQMQRDRVMSRFKDGNINILVASDVAARGIDVDDVEVVFNYDLPTDLEYYVHRIGRTGRAKKEGLAISLVSRNEKRLLKEITLFSKAIITAMDTPKLEDILKRRIKRMIDKAKEEDTSSKASKIIDKIMKEFENEECSKDSLIKGLILMQMKSIDETVEVEELKEEIERRKIRRESSEERIWINIGRKDKLKVYHLTDFLIANTSLNNDEINNVDILDNFSYFEIPRKKLDEILTNLPKEEYLGRKILVQRANKKDDSKKNSKPKSNKESIKNNTKKYDVVKSSKKDNKKKHNNENSFKGIINKETVLKEYKRLKEKSTKTSKRKF